MLLINLHTTKGQSPSIIPLPAEAAALFQYNSTPVSMMTGVPQISYPIYEINTGKIKVPITLSYHASGIKVTQKATWVGLGWSLLAGGSIARQIRGDEDETTTSGWFNQSTPISSFGSVLTYDGRKNYYESRPDLQPDFFNYNFTGKSGRFLYSRDLQDFVTAPYKPVRIIHTSDNNYEITDDDGSRYFFTKPFKTTTDNTGLQSHIIGWNLTKIISNDGADSVIFNYATPTASGDKAADNVLTFNKVYRKNVSGTDDAASYVADEVIETITYSYNSVPNISEIIFRQGKVKLYGNTVRSDYAGNALDSIVVYSNDNGTYNRVKKVSFNYSYFYTGNSYPSYTDYRLKLLSFSNDDLNGEQPEKYTFGYNSTTLPNTLSCSQDWWGFYNGVTQYTLMPRQLPSQTTIQMYGYLGTADRSSSATYIMAGILNQVTYPTGGYTTYDYAINTYERTPDNKDSTIASITLAGPAKTGVTYGWDSATTTFLVRPPGNNQYYYELKISIDFSASSANPPFTYAQDVQLRDITTGKTVASWNSDTYLNAGTSGIAHTLTATYTCDTSHTYQLYVGINDLPTTTVTARISIAVPDNSTKYKYGGGIRVETISSYNLDNTLQKKDVYKYGENESGIGYLPTSADDMTTNIFYNTTTRRYIATSSTGCKTEDGDKYTYIAQSSYPTITFQGANVLYPYVTKYEYSNTRPNGKTIFTYKIPNDFITIGNQSALGGKERIDNGLSDELPIKTTYYKFNSEDSSFSVIKETINTWDLFNFSQDSALMVFPTVEYSTTQHCGDSYLDYSSFVYMVKSGGRHLSAVTENNYDDNGTVFSNTVSYTYNDKNHPQTITKFNSKNDTLVTEMRYPGEHSSIDVNADVLDHMVTKNMLNQFYWQGNYTNATLLSYKHTLFSDSWGSNDSLIAPKIDSNWQLGNDNSLPAITIAYQSYGQHGNIRQIRDAQGITTAYTWSADDSYPVAQTAGAAVNQVIYDGFEDANSWTGITRDNTVSHTGRYAGLISGGTYTNATWNTISLSTATTFRYSGWVYSNGPTATLNLLMKTSSETGNYTYIDNVSSSQTGKWIYLEKEYTIPAGVAYVSLRLDNNSSGKVWFDEVSLRPSASQMSHYSFLPLVGMSSKTDEGNHTIYYEFDGLNRLKLIRNKDKNILKMYCYNYAGDIDRCEGTTYYNDYQSQTYAKTCVVSGASTTVTYAVDAGKYSSRTSVADANSKALADIAANGQAYANLMGDCSYYLSEQMKDTFTAVCADNGVGSAMVYSIAEGTDTSFISQDDANTKAKARLNLQGQLYANSNGCTWTNEVQSGTYTKVCSSSSAEGTAVIYTVAAGTYSSAVSLAAANALALQDVTSNGQAYANTNGLCYYYSDVQSAIATTTCSTGYVGTDVTFTVAARHDSSLISKDSANAAALRYAKANAQSNANSTGTCLACNLILSKKSGSSNLGTFNVSVVNSTTGASVYNQSFTDPTDAQLATCYRIASDAIYTITVTAQNNLYATINGTEKAISPGHSQSWLLGPTLNIVLSSSGTITYSNTAVSKSVQKNSCTKDSTGSYVTYTVAASKYTSTVSQEYVDSLANVDAANNGQTYANTNGYCFPSGKNFAIVVKKGGTDPGTLSITATNTSTSTAEVKTTAITEWPYYAAITSGKTFTISIAPIGSGISMTADVNGTQKTVSSGSTITFTSTSAPILILIWNK
ncbi:DUF5977 domain-containing protein [Chitinophaga sp. LS1]|uniref:DUF5977 domain-containing protein n=1 Tax=Chitinophaga sp. LS1 TaxID=3051176 RepID=UPI002AAB32F4|nr:DUF5977 domain-containing protein [Chitinophaga sp. LS1]WPV69296.1 DUF5977 domain-containing protein [Chitinophaga sp. LS1]